MNNINFAELSDSELKNTDGGFISLGAAVAILVFSYAVGKDAANRKNKSDRCLCQLVLH